jgi:hypothetical protein
VIDVPLIPDLDGLWTNESMPAQMVPLEDITWVAADGIQYLKPKIVMLYKAGTGRPKDDHDLQQAWPLLRQRQGCWLLDVIRATEPGRPW